MKEEYEILEGKPGRCPGLKIKNEKGSKSIKSLLSPCQKPQILAKKPFPLQLVNAEFYGTNDQSDLFCFFVIDCCFQTLTIGQS